VIRNDRKEPGDVVPYACSRCGNAYLLLAKIGEEYVCARCWKAMGSPWPHKSPDWQREVEVRKGMMARSGDQRYRVTSGKT
jgi:DNA-directed RNA polymerase subunit RPC12/RpoP